ncbi:hypothetical protein HHI36_002278, partial [Cryptolaemus montrouzieri]
MDQNIITSTRKKEGGVLMAVKQTLIARVRVESIDVEHLFVKIDLGPRKIKIDSTYIPPASNNIIYNSHCLAVEQMAE